MILSYQSIKVRGSYMGDPGMIEPMVERTLHEASGMTFGLGPCGYDIRIKQDLVMPKGTFRLASSVEHFNMPIDLCAHIRDKSTLIRNGLYVGNTVIEPGWRGHLTLELFYTGRGTLYLTAGQPIAQVQFAMLDQPTNQPYAGKYQDQVDEIVPAIREHESAAEYIMKRIRLPDVPEEAA